MQFPARFGRYLLLERINAGGMAEVLRAKTFGVEGFERFVAIKRILPSFEADENFVKMFIDEARIAVQLNHPNIAQIYELGRHEDLLYIVMEYVAGMDLRHILRDYRRASEKMQLPAAAYIGTKICEGLEYAHAITDPSGKPLNLVHRDISPQNILLNYDGAVKVTDFGIAKAEDRRSQTQSGVLKGKFGYMSPEQLTGQELDRRSDIFAVGILLYQMATNVHLFRGESDLATLEKVRSAKYVPATKYNPELPPEFERVLQKALARDRADRYASATDLYDDLQRFVIFDQTIFDAKRLGRLLRSRYRERYETEKQKLVAFGDVAAPADTVDDAIELDSGEWEALTEVFEAAEHPYAPPLSLSSSTPTASTTAVPQSGDVSPPGVHTDTKGSATQADPDPEMGNNLGQPSAIGPGAVGPDPRPHAGATGGPPPVDDDWATGASEDAPTLALRPEDLDAPTPVVADPFDGPAPHPHDALGKASASQSTQIASSAHAPHGGERPGAMLRTSEHPTPTDLEIPSSLPPDYVAGPGRPVATYVAIAASLFLVIAGLSVWAVHRRSATASNRGSLVVATRPPVADVFLDGTLIGQSSPSLHDDIAPGNHVLEVRANGYADAKQQVTIRVREPTSVSVVLTRLTPQRQGTLQVTTTPSGANVSRDGVPLGVTPLLLPNLDRTHPINLILSLEGYADERVAATFETDEAVLRIDVALKVAPAPTPTPTPKAARPSPEPSGKKKRRTAPTSAAPQGSPNAPPQPAPRKDTCDGKDGKLSVMARQVSDCEVSIGDTVIGITPFFRRNAPSGHCRVRVRCPSGEKYSKVLHIPPNDEAKLIIQATDWKSPAPPHKPQP